LDVNPEILVETEFDGLDKRYRRTRNLKRKNFEKCPIFDRTTTKRSKGTPWLPIIHPKLEKKADE
jgi:hypothetical protein